jgi:hypothetical protein
VLREHWGIENKLHYVRDVTCREDQARANARNAPQALAALRNTTLTLLRRLGFKPVRGLRVLRRTPPGGDRGHTESENRMTLAPRKRAMACGHP